MLVPLDEASHGKFAQEGTGKDGAEVSDVHGHDGQHPVIVILVCGSILWR